MLESRLPFLSDAQSWTWRVLSHSLILLFVTMAARVQERRMTQPTSV